MLILSLLINLIFVCYIIYRICQSLLFTKYFINIRIINRQLKKINKDLDGRYGLPYEYNVGQTNRYPLEIVEKIKQRLIRKGFAVEIIVSDNTYTYLFIS